MASRYADQFSTHYQDVLELLDQLRLSALSAQPPRPPDPAPPAAEGGGVARVLATSPNSVPGDVKAGGIVTSVSSGQLSSLSSSPDHHSTAHYLPTHYSSTDGTLYVPGKYNVSN